jgi:putative ABC transport system permease protein
MFQFYSRLALRGLLGSPVLTGLMVLAIGIGIGASVSTLTVLRALSGNPLPDRSAKLFYAQLDPRDHGATGDEPPFQMSYVDAQALLSARRAERQAAMSGGSAAVEPASGDLNPFLISLRFTSSDFFPMFEVPFLFGKPWTAADDAQHARLVVLSKALNDRLFGGVDSVGQHLRMEGKDVVVAGVIAGWRPNPHFYDLNTGNYSESEDAFVPLETAIDLKFGLSGSLNCWTETPSHGVLRSPMCGWLQFWVMLSTPEQREQYLRFLQGYSQEQHEIGRFQRPPNARLRNLMEWLDFRQVVPEDVRLQVWLAGGFLVVCLVNTMGLMLAKFLRRSGEIGIRRALGATRSSVFIQFLAEAVAVGMLGAALGLLVAGAAVYAIRMQSLAYVSLIHLDGVMLTVGILMALAASIVAGIFPAWRAGLVEPALQIKGQ